MKLDQLHLLGPDEVGRELPCDVCLACSGRPVEDHLAPLIEEVADLSEPWAIDEQLRGECFGRLGEPFVTGGSHSRFRLGVARVRFHQGVDQGKVRSEVEDRAPTLQTGG